MLTIRSARASRRHAGALEIARAVIEQVQAQHDALRGMFDGVADGLALFDASDRLIACNRACTTAYARITDRRIHGARYVDLARAAIACAHAGLDSPAQERLVARFIDWHHQGGEPRLQRWSDGRWMRITERRLPNGCTVATFRDVDETPSPMYNPLLTYARQV
ncbi:MAG TPA: PAS-domain containing protein [Burkholderiaceae bacterium]|nr:PAS-domain containing protein [Burkholderiaceae bacterium]